MASLVACALQVPFRSYLGMTLTIGQDVVPAARTVHEAHSQAYPKVSVSAIDRHCIGSALQKLVATTTPQRRSMMVRDL
jgi:hypothetical protein